MINLIVLFSNNLIIYYTIKDMISLTNLVSATDFTIFYIIIVCCLLALLAGVIILFRFMLSSSRSSYYNTFESTNNYVVDLTLKKVTRYNLKNFKDKKVFNLDRFLYYFSLLDRENFYKWLIDLGNKKGVDMYDRSSIYLATIVDRRLKSRNQRCLFLVKKVDELEKKIYLDSLKLYNLPVAESKNKTKIKKVDFAFGEIKKLYEDGYFAKGSSFIIRFKKKESASSYFNEYFLRYVIIDGLYKIFKTNSVYFYFKNEEVFEIDILDKDFITIYQTREQINKIKSTIKTIFEQYGYFNVYTYSLVGTLVSELSHDYDLMYKALNDRLNINFEERISAYLYRKEEQNNEDNMWALSTEVIKVVSSQGIEPYFKPIIQLKQNNIIIYGYCVNFKVNSDKFDSIEALKKAAHLTNNLRAIFGLCLKKSIPLYLANRDNFFAKIVFLIHYNEISLAMQNLPYINKLKEAHIIFLFEIVEFLDIENIGECVKTIRNLQVKGFEIGLLIRKGEFQINKELYKNVDFFFVDCELESNVKADSKSFVSAHTLLDKLIVYQKPIIEINARSFAEIELLYRSGIQFFSSDVISVSQPMMTPLDKKVIKRIENMMK